jgi:microcystin-dependent protein
LADDRPLLSDAERVSVLERKLADIESTFAARMARRPVGDVELAFRGTPKPGTLFLQGQTLNRADYPALWQWAQDVGAVVTGGYGAGNGSTTFTLPDMRGRVPIGVGTGAGGTYALGQLVGSATVALTTAELAAHGHTTSSYFHEHSGVSNYDGNHGGHVSSSVGRTTGSDFAAHPTTSGSGDHRHGIPADSHTHTVNNTGSGTAHENRQPSLGINFAVWT